MIRPATVAVQRRQKVELLKVTRALKPAAVNATETIARGGVSTTVTRTPTTQSRPRRESGCTPFLNGGH